MPDGKMLQDTMKRQVAGNSLERKSSFLSDGTLEQGGSHLGQVHLA